MDNNDRNYTLTPTPQEASLRFANRWIGLVTILVGLASLVVGTLYIVLLIWRVFPLPTLVESLWPWFLSVMVACVYSYMSLVFTVTIEQMGSVGKSGFAFALVGVAFTLVGGFDGLFDFGIVGQPLSILGVSI